MSQKIPIRSWICNDSHQVKQTMGSSPECLICEKKIVVSGQVIMFGIMNFVEYCNDHIQYCNTCGALPDPGTMLDGKIYCNVCY